MGRDFFRLEKGIHVVGENSDVGVHILFGAGAPGTQTQENNAEVGSIYQDTNAPGYLYHKKAAGSGTDKWARVANYDDILDLGYRSEKVVVLTSLAAPIEGGTIDLSSDPFPDDDAPELAGTDFTEGDYILFGHGGTEVLGKVGDVTGDVLTITYLDFPALSARNVFVVANYLPDVGDSQEKQAVVLFNGSEYIKLGDVNWNFADGINMSAGYTPGSGNPSSSDTVESAIEKIDGNVDNVNSVLGTAQSDTDLGEFDGGIISDDTSVKSALQELETDLDAVQTLTGVAAEEVDLGTFTGTTIPDDQTIKQALQSLETHAERGFLEKSSTGITTAVTVDEVKVDDVSAVEWTIMTELASDPARRRVEKMIAVHNGTPSADATETDDNAYSIVRLGTSFNQVVAVDLDGTGSSQIMRLRVSASSGINVRVFRSVIKAS